tara:strand:- start:17 stop:229 length:213 start_codon:yes stop_codon:yes gene_type:complete
MSLHFGRHFWLDEDNELCSCPTNLDGTPDKDAWDYVSEWTDLDGLDLGKLLYIHKDLIVSDAVEYYEARV